MPAKELNIPEITDKNVLILNVTRYYREWKADEVSADNRTVLYNLLRKGWNLDTNRAPDIKYIYAVAD